MSCQAYLHRINFRADRKSEAITQVLSKRRTSSTIIKILLPLKDSNFKPPQIGCLHEELASSFSCYVSQWQTLDQCFVVPRILRQIFFFLTTNTSFVSLARKPSLSMKNQYNLNTAINHFYAGSDIEIIVDWHFSYAPKDEDELGEKKQRKCIFLEVSILLRVLVILMALIFFIQKCFVFL